MSFPLSSTNWKLTSVFASFIESTAAAREEWLRTKVNAGRPGRQSNLSVKTADGLGPLGCVWVELSSELEHD